MVGQAAVGGPGGGREAGCATLTLVWAHSALNPALRPTFFTCACCRDMIGGMRMDLVKSR